MNEENFESMLTQKTQDSTDKNAQMVCEVYLNGELKEAELVSDRSTSYGVFMHTLTLSNESKIINCTPGKYEVSGSEDEKAMALYSLNRGFNKNLIESLVPRVSECVLDKEAELGSAIYSLNEKYRIVSKASPVELMRHCVYVVTDSGIVKLSRKIVKEINKAFWFMVEKGLKVYALAIKDVTDINDSLEDKSISRDMIFVGMIGIGKM
jgi:magnesium-transporting ATPase (P-type)